MPASSFRHANNLPHATIGQRPMRLAGLAAVMTLSLMGASADAAGAQTAAIRVEVAVGPLPVEGATVSAGGVTASTDANGVGWLTLAPGSVSVVASKEGYEPATARLDVAASEARTVRLALTRSTGRDGAIVATTRTGRPIEDQAIPVAVLDRDQIEARILHAPGDIATLFAAIPGLRAQTTSPILGTTSLRVRGLPGHYTRLIADGAPLYGDRPGGHAFLRVSPMDLGQVEVLAEPASALFGSDAIGIVNVLSARPGNAPVREVLFNQSARGATDAALWIASPPGGSWSSTFLVGLHRQTETDVDDDGWSDLPEYQRAVVRPHVFWNNGRGRMVAGVAGVTFETREGGSATVRESLETKTAEGSLTGQMILRNGFVLAGAAVLFVQSRTHDYPHGREGDRFQTATIEFTLRRPGTRHTWLAGIASDWYALRSAQADLPSKYVSTRPGIFFHDEMIVRPWLVITGSARLDEHNLHGFLLSPRGSALLRGGGWDARFSASQGYFTARPFTGETEAAGLARLTVEEPLEVETVRSVSAGLTRRAGPAAVTLAVFRTQIDDPARIDRATYTLRTEAEPIVSQGVELLATFRRAPYSVTGTYAYVHARERGDRDIALTPRHRAGLVAGAATSRGRLGLELAFTGTQRLDRNPYRSTSESYLVVGFVGERQFGRLRVFVTANNLTDVRQTDWDPIARPAADVDGRWTVDAWAPLAGRVINAGLKISF